jgi:hypothetical protein
VFSANVTGRSQSVWSSRRWKSAQVAQALAAYQGQTRARTLPVGTMTKACQSNKDRKHELWPAQPPHHLLVTRSSVPQRQIIHVMHRWAMAVHRNNRAPFLLRQIESEPTRAISPYRVSLNEPFFGVHAGGGWTIVMCLARLSTAPISYT